MLATLCAGHTRASVAGAVSVAPKPVRKGISSPQVLYASCFISSNTCCGSAAPANHRTFSFEKKLSRRSRVGAQIRQQGFEAFRHVEVPGRSDVAQVAHRGFDRAGHRLALVDVIRAAVVEHQAQVVVAGGGVVPRRPVHQHRRLVAEEGQHRQDHFLVRAPHALGVDHRLRRAGGAGGEEELDDGVGADAGMRLVDRAGGRRLFQAIDDFAPDMAPKPSGTSFGPTRKPIPA